MNRRFNKCNMPKDPSPMGAQGAAQTTPVLTRRNIDLNRRASARSLRRGLMDTNSQSVALESTSGMMRQTSIQRNALENRPISDPQSRLLSRRKQYSQSKVPTIALNEPDMSTSTPNIPIQHRQETASMASGSRSPEQTEIYSSSTSPSYYMISPKVNNLSPDGTCRAELGYTQRALSASPSKMTMVQSPVVLKAQPLLASSSGSIDSVGQSRFVGSFYPYGRPGYTSTPNHTTIPRSPLCTPSDNSPLPTTPVTMHSISPTALSPATAHSKIMSPNNLVQQRSTESHESSVSMPSATSSGSGGMPYGPGTRIFGRLGSKQFARSTENPSAIDAGDNSSPRNDSHSLQRRSSYEMATGKLEQPQRKSKRSSWRNAFNVLKEKRDALFRRNFKNADDANEVSDPVYHLLRCAATLDHQPSNCKCICHMQDFESDPHLLEMSAPINVLFSPTAKDRPSKPIPPSLKHRFAQSKLPASLPTLYPDEENSPLPPTYMHAHEHTGKKNTFSLPNILNRRRGQKDTSSSRALDSNAQSFDSERFERNASLQGVRRPVSVGRSQSKNPVFTFD